MMIASGRLFEDVEDLNVRLISNYFQSIHTSRNFVFVVQARHRQDYLHPKFDLTGVRTHDLQIMNSMNSTF